MAWFLLVSLVTGLAAEGKKGDPQITQILQIIVASKVRHSAG